MKETRLYMTSKFSHLSASQINLFKDTCQRKWYEIYINGETQPTSKALERGKLVHSYVEEYILRGTLPDTETEEGLIATAGLAFLPKFEQGKVFVEHSLDAFPPLSPTIKFKGFIDCLIVGDDYIEILDHKTTSAKKYMLTELELMTNTQLIIYARHAMQAYPHAKFKLSHIYYLTSGKKYAEKRSVEVDREHIMKVFTDMVPTIKSMIKAYDQQIDDMEKNEASCFAYGQRCPFFLRCKRDNLNDLTDILVPQEKEHEMTTNTDLLRHLFTQKGMIEPMKQEQTQPTPPPTQEIEPCVLFVSAHVVKGAIPTLALDALKPFIQEICAREKVPHISVIQYGRGYDMLCHLLTQQGRLPCSMQIDARSFEYQKIGATLESLADIVVRGV
jgi:hypothetical protein